MKRVCGADRLRDPKMAARCWCGGVFCGIGGLRLSRAFQFDFRTTETASSRAQLVELMAQQVLFLNEQTRQKWIDRLKPSSGVHA